MSDEMTRLADVQSHDLEIDALLEERDRTPEELTHAVARQEQLEQQLAAKRQEFENRNAEIRASELELGALQERRKAAANSALTAGSAKEVSQFQNQEIMFATRVQEVEEDLLPLMEDAERLANEVEELSSQLGEIKPVVAELRQAEEERVQGIDAKSASLTEQRASMVDGIGASLLSIYEQVRKARKGVGMAEVLGGSRCSGCNVHLPIHVVQKVRKNIGIVRCPSCGRILHYTD